MYNIGPYQQHGHQERLVSPQKTFRIAGSPGLRRGPHCGNLQRSTDPLAGGEKNISSPRTPPLWAIRALLFVLSGFEASAPRVSPFPSTPRMLWTDRSLCLGSFAPRPSPGPYFIHGPHWNTAPRTPFSYPPTLNDLLLPMNAVYL